MKKQKPKSQVPAIVGMVLTLGCATAFSLLAAFDVITLDVEGKKAPQGTMRPPPRSGFEERETVNTPDPPLDPAEEARLAGEREKLLRERAGEELQLLDQLRIRAAKDNAYGMQLARFHNDQGIIVSAFYSPDGQTVTTVGVEDIQVWELTTGKCRHRFPGQTKKTHAAAYSPDGKLLATGNTNRIVHLREVVTGETVRKLDDHPGDVEAVAFSPNGKSLAVLSDGVFTKDVRIWDLSTGKVGRIFPDARRVGDTLAYTADGQTILAPRFDEVLLFNSQTGRLKRTIKGGNYLAVSHDGKTIAMGTNEGLKLWAVRDGSLLKTIKTETDSVRWGAFSPDNKWLATHNWQDKGGTRLWDVALGTEHRRIDMGGLIRGLQFSPGGRFLAVGGNGVDLMSVDELLEVSPTTAGTIAKFATLRRTPQGFMAELKSETKDSDLGTLKELPRLTGVDCSSAQAVTDAGLKHLAELLQLQELILPKGATDAGLAHLKGLTKLHILDLHDSEKITDAGMQHLKGLTALRRLNLQRTKVTAAGLGHLKELTALEFLDLRSLPVTDAAMTHLKGMVNLRELNLESSQIGDAGVAHLSGMKLMRKLDIAFNRDITGAGLVALKDMVEMEELNLGYTSADDAGLLTLKGLTKLKRLKLTNTAVTDAGLMHLSAMTGMTEFDCAGLEGVKGPGLKALQEMKGMKVLNLAAMSIDDAGFAVIKDFTHLEDLSLPRSLTDAGLVHLAGLVNIKKLSCRPVEKLKGSGLVHLKGMKGLSELNLDSNTKLTDDGLRGLAALEQLRKLRLPPQITNAGVAHLAGLKQLTELSLHMAPITDEGAAHLKGMTDLTLLDLSNTKVTDAALEHFTGMKKLGNLFLMETAVSKEAIEKLKKSLPGTFISK